MGIDNTFHTLLLLVFGVSTVLSYHLQKHGEQCPRLYSYTYSGCIPRGNLSAGHYDKIDSITKLEDCVVECCLKDTCNVAFMNKDKCYHIQCDSDELCLPTPSENPDTSKFLSMVLVKPTGPYSWEDVIQQQVDPELDGKWQKEMYILKDLLKDPAYGSDLYCEVGAENMCAPNEICVPQHAKSRSGVCQCIEGYMRRHSGECVPILLGQPVLHAGPSMADIITERIIEKSTANQSAPVTKKQLTVVAESKEVRLPVNNATLHASVTPVDPEAHYQYEWISLHQPKDSTAVKHQNGGQLQLDKLTEGLYSFKVTASNPSAYGETFVNVTVLPAKRINQPPNIIITPANQTIKLPNSVAVLDASSSKDDDAIISWHWELQQAPLGYEPRLKDSPTLQLNDLTKPGNYSFKLTATDSDHVTSSAIANITVLAVTDYPPEANAGEDKIIYLPHNSITLNGSLSTDDHAITTWEWTKAGDDAQKAVDMQDTRTPYLQLSNLEEGIYTFALKVTDSANQSSTAQVHVFVKPPTNKPPVASAGQNQTISLPQTWVVLDASGSTDDNKIMAFKWEQIEGPSRVVFDDVNATKTNVTGLTKGVYQFKVSVTDDNKNVASDKVYVTVNQNKNQKPTANAGPDFEIELPKNMAMLNGSNSKDDWAIVKWKWSRDEKSLALGSIAEKTDETPVLILTDLTMGKYIFNLTVYDEQGLSDTDSVTFVVKNDPRIFYLVEITINVDAKVLTEAQYNNVKGKLALLVKDGSKLQVRSVRPQPATSKAVVTFYVEGSNGKLIPANDVVHHLRDKLRVDASLLGFTVANLRTAVCQNDCSGHGVCDEVTRQCRCEAFWMQDMFKVYLETDGDSDCSWSILYVVLGMICSVLIFIGTLWGLVHLCYTWCNKKQSSSKPTNYKLIEDTEDLPPFSARKSNLSDSDTDSDVVFESRSKPSRNGGHYKQASSRNGFHKMGRRIKT
nr:unnamed protein product [Callosobruchus analis]